MSVKKFLWTALLLTVVTSLVLSACGAPATEPAAEPTEAPAPPPTSPPPEVPPAEAKVLKMIFTQEPAALNPYYSNMWFELILHQIWNCWPWPSDDKNEAYPNLVTELPSTENGGISEDGLTITMNLRDDIVWSDGTPITSADFDFTYKMVMDPKNGVSSQNPYDKLTGLETPDERTVVMKFAEPFAPWKALFWRGMLPKHILEPVFEAEGTLDTAEWNLAPSVGCGPYVFAEWESGGFQRYVKNENYWLGAPKIDEIFIQFVPDDASQTAALIAGDADIGTFPPLTDVPALQDTGMNIMIQASGYNEGWFFNFRPEASPGMSDVRVRRAIAMGIDRDAINRDLLLGLTKAPATFWDAMPSYVPPGIKPWPYDPEAAKALLEEAGWTDKNGDGIREDAKGNKLTLVHGTTIRGIRQDVQAVAQQQLLEIGIDLQLMSQESDLFFGSYSDGAAVALGEVDIMEWSDAPYFPDPDTDYWLCDQLPTPDNPYGYNYFGCDEKLDKLSREQRTLMKAEERQAVVQEIVQYMYDNINWLGIYEDPDYWVVSSRLTGVKFSGVTPFYNIAEWDFTQ